MLVDGCADVNATDDIGQTPLMSSVQHFSWNGSIAIVEYMLSKNVDINRQNDIGETAFYQFAKNPRSACQTLRLFLDAGVDTSLMCERGNLIELLKNEALPKTVAMMEVYFDNKKLESIIDKSFGQQDGIAF